MSYFIVGALVMLAGILIGATIVITAMRDDSENI